MPAKSISAAQIIGVLAFTLALFFVVAFATKSIDAYRLRGWGDRLNAEIAGMERQREELQEEVRRRQSMAWVDEVLREAGWVPKGVISVVAVTSTPNPELSPAPQPLLAETSSPLEQQTLFDNPNWEAWQRLIWGFDGGEDSYYTEYR